MSMSAQYAENIFSGNGVTTVFTTNIVYQSADQIEVFLRLDDVDTETTAFSVAQSVTGYAVVTMTTAPADTLEVVIRRNTPLTQEADIGRVFRPDVIEDALDRVVMMIQEADRNRLPVPIADAFLIGNSTGTGWINHTVAPEAPAISRFRIYETMDDAIDDGDGIVAAAANGIEVCVAVKGGQHNGDGGKCDFFVRSATGSEDVRAANGRRYGSEFKLFFGANDGAYTVWPDGVVPGVAFGWQSHEWSAGANSAAQALDSMAHNDALLLRANHFIGNGGGMKLILPPGEFTIRDNAYNGDISTDGCAFLGSGVERTKIHIGHFTDEFGESKWDNGSGGPNASIITAARIRFINTGYLQGVEIGEFSLYGEHMCGRGVMIEGTGRIHDMYIEKTNDRPSALTNPSGSVWDSFDPESYDGTIENMKFYQCLGTLVSTYGQTNLLIRNIKAKKCYAEVVTNDASFRAHVTQIRAENVCRRDDAAGTPVEGLYDNADDDTGDNETAGNGGVAALVLGGAGAQYVTLSDFHIDGISEDKYAATPEQGKYAIAIRPKANPDSGKITIANGTVNKARGFMKVQTMWDTDLVSAQSGHHISVTGCHSTNIKQDNNCGEFRIDEGCTNVNIIGFSTDNDYVKIIGNHSFSNGNRNGTQVQTPQYVHPSCQLIGLSPRAPRDWFEPLLVGDTTTPAVLGDWWSIVRVESGECFFQFGMLNINPAALTGTTEVRIALPYRSSSDIINASPLIFGAYAQQITYTGTLGISIAANALYANLIVSASASNRTNVVPANIGSNAELTAQLRYPITI